MDRQPSTRRLALVDALPLRTARLTLRALSPDDTADVAATLGDPGVMRHFPRPLTHAETAAWLARTLRRYGRDGTGLFAVCREGHWIGNCGIVLRRIDEDVVPELGYHFRRDVWGHGYAREAAAACVALAFAKAQVPILAALIRPQNVRSRRVAAALGFRVRGMVVHEGLAHERWLRGRAGNSG